MKLKSQKVKPFVSSLLLILLGILFLVPISVNANQISYAEDEIIVKFKSGTNIDKTTDKHSTWKIHRKNQKLRLARIKLPKGTDVKNEILKLKGNPDIEYVQPNYIYSVELIPNDPNYNLQWGLPKIKADQAWDISTGNNSVTVAIIDTGVDTDHPDLAASLVTGYNAINNSSNANDDHGHGTHVAGIAAGIINNSAGISGVSGKSRIMPVKVLGSNGSGYTSDITEGIYWAVDHGAKVINMSLGGPYYDQASQDAVDYAYSKGVIVIAAAGNDNTSSPSYPAALNHVIAVSATDQNNGKAWFSNYGSYVDLAAPGVSIYSSTFDGSYGYKSGTSMASPFVAGAAALLLSQDNTMTPSELETTLENTALDLGAAGRDNNFGYGLIDVNAAIKTVNPTLPPKGNIDKPGGLETISGNYAVSGWFLDGASVSKIEVLVDQNVMGEAIYGDPRPDIGSVFPDYNNNNCGFHFDLDTTKLTSGTHSLTVRETGSNGVQTTLSGKPINVSNNLPPIGSLENPKGLETISGTYTVKGWFLDQNIVSKIEVLVDGEVMGEAIYGDSRPDIASRYPQYNNNNCGFHFDLNSTMLSNGSHTINIREIAKNGVQKTLTDTPFTVSNTNPLPPIGDIEDPQWFQLISKTYTIKGWFLDGNTVSKIEVLIDGSIMGEAIYGDPRPDIYQTYPGYKNANAGFHFDLDTTKLSEGEHTINIRETNKNGNQTTLMGVNVTVIKSTVPTKSKAVTIRYILSESSIVTIAIYDSLNNLVRVLENKTPKLPGTNTAFWDGKDSSGTIVGDGIYTYKITAVDLAGLSSEPITGTITIERLNPFITSVSDSPDPLVPSKSPLNTIKYTLSENANVVITIFDADNNPVKTLTRGIVNVGANSAVWDGTNDSGSLVENGTYTYKIDAADAFYKKAVPATGTISVDSTPPVISLNSMVPNLFAPTGSNDASIVYTLSEKARVTVSILDKSGSLIRALEDNTLKYSGVNSTAWDGKNSSGNIVEDGIYTYKITAVDMVGLDAIPATDSFTVEGSSPRITSVSDSPNPFIPKDASVNTIKYTLSEQAHITIKLFDSNNNLVKTLVDSKVDPGENSVTWNGTNTSGTIVNSGIYTYKIDAVDSAGKKADQVSRTILVDVEPPSITNLTVTPNPFEPIGSNFITISYTLSENADTTVEIYDQVNILIDTLEIDSYKISGENSIKWDGKDSSGRIVKDGTYTCKISAIDSAGFRAEPATAIVIIERNNPSIDSVSDGPDPFTPDGSKVSTIKYALSENADVTLKLYDSSNSLIKTLINDKLAAGSSSTTWDGRDASGALVASGIYTYKIDAADAYGKKANQVCGTITVDLTPPVISSLMVSSSNFSPINDETTTIYYNLSEAAKTTVNIYDASGKLVDTLENNLLKASGANSVVWDGYNSSGTLMKDGVYTYKISAVDLAGLSAVPVSGKLTVTGTVPVISAVNDSPDPFSPNGKNTNTIKYSLSKNIKISLNIYDKNNTLVKTLVNGTISAGSRSAAWNGTNNTGSLVNSGAYTYRVTAFNAKNKIVDQVSGIISVDLTPPVISTNLVSPEPFAPLGNNTMSISYVLSESAKVSVSIYDSSNKLVKILENSIPKPAGTNSVGWDGKDASGMIVKDGSYTYKITAVDLAGLSAQPVTGNITVLHANPAILSVSDSPDPFKPDGASVNTIQYTLSEDANVTIKIYDGNSNLIKALVNEPLKAGSNTAVWNGKNDGGILADTGIYTYKIDASNSFNKAAEQVSGNITVDLTPPTISAGAVYPSTFAPSGKNYAAIMYNLSESASVTIGIYDGSNNLVKTIENKSLKNAGFNSVNWDGRNSSGAIVKDGMYTYKITAVDLVGFPADPANGTIKVETDPVVTLLGDSPDPFRPTGSNANTIKFALSKTATVVIKIYNSNNNPVATLGNSTFAPGDSSLAWFGTDSKGVRVGSGKYTYRIDATDALDKKAPQVSGTITVDLTPPVISTHSVNPDAFVPTGSNGVDISYELSEAAIVTLTIYDSSNNPVRILESSVLKTSKSNLTGWDGRDSSGVPVGDGLYTYKITAVDLVNLEAVPATGTIVVGAKPEIKSVSDGPDPFRPTGANVNTIKYTLSKDCNISIKIYDVNGQLVKILAKGSAKQGENLAVWNGKNDNGSLVGNGVYTYWINATDTLGRTADAVSGTITVDVTPPEITNHTASPNPFTPKQ